MGMTWTDDQKKVIDLRHRNILVSAAAGSGKTAVLVERIISMILDEEHPTDIDRLLIVTFTRAAANEMRERIGAALEKKLEQDPENEHLQKQTTLLHHAQINTIDGFCSYVIRNYFHMIDLDPGYRMADEGELKLLKADVAAEVLESCYEQKEPSFLNFVESYATGKTDEGIADLIWGLYDYACSAPWPERWLQDAKEPYRISSWEELENTPWMQFLWNDMHLTVKEMRDLAQENKDLLAEEHAPLKYEPMLAEDLAGMEYAAQSDSFGELCKRIRLISFSGLKACGKDVDPDLRDRIKSNRERLKDMHKDLKSRCFFADPDQMLQTLQACAAPVGTLIDMALMFSEAYARKKREKNLLDFSDLEHLALKILLEEDETGQLRPSEAAKELSAQFDEIMIDEYQDSNLVQEYLLSQVSGMIRGEYNTFMVGDVKQSIYRFRQARPELFMEKLDRYTLTDSAEQKVGLAKNFRSRAEVLDTVNYFFRQLMRREVGGVEYDDAAALYLGASFEEGARKEFPRTEILVIETAGADASAKESSANGTTAKESSTKESSTKESSTNESAANELSEDKKELEPRTIGMRIRQIVGRELVWDKKDNAYRPARYSDCVILLRTMSGWAEVFGKTLIGMGIPAYSTSRTGYFSAIEVQTVLNFLQICDNPCQELPYTAVLASPFAGCSPEELAKIKCIEKEQPLYRCAKLYVQQGEDAALKEKLQAFFDFYNDICDKSHYTPIHELIWYLVQSSGYGDYVSALPGGEQRIANVRMLVEKAVDYEKTSYGGLYHFIRYIEYLKKYEVDFGEANIVGENDDTVRIMSIHKSKGLEFPVVFVAGMAKNFNKRDMNGPVLVDADFGVASSYMDFEKRVKCPTIIRGAFYRKALKESLGEELRVLYVAMTRAKEKLILTGTVAKYKEAIGKYTYLKERTETQLPVSLLMSANNYWGWILPSLVRVGAVSSDLDLGESAVASDLDLGESAVASDLDLGESAVASDLDLGESAVSSDLDLGESAVSTDLDPDESSVSSESDLSMNRSFSDTYKVSTGLRAPIDIYVLRGLDLLVDEAQAESKRVLSKEELFRWDTASVYDQNAKQTIADRFSYVYPYDAGRDMPVKVSVSELKHQHMEEDESVQAFAEPEVIPLIPEFLKEEKEEKLDGASRGTAYHAFMERVELSDCGDEQAVADQIEWVKEHHFLTEMEAACLKPEDFVVFVRSSLGQRMQAAQRAGLLKREQPFVLGMPAVQIDAEWPEEETVLIQGIIDAYFYEGDEIVVVDYKTDRIQDWKRGDEELRNKYRVQLEYYGEALERLTGKKVKEKMIYSFTLRREVKISE